jgi:hypothetical protein
VRLDAGEGQREMPVIVLRTVGGIGQQGDRLAFIEAPRPRRRDPLLQRPGGQPPVIGAQHVAAFLGRDRRGSAPTCREHLRHAELIEPVRLFARAQVDAAQHQALTRSGWAWA